MSWILDNIGVIVFFIVAFSFVRKLKEAFRRAQEETEKRGKVRPVANFDPDEAERVRKIQEEIRRKIAERRGESTPAASRETALPDRPPLLRPTETPSSDPLNPLDTPMRRMFSELERRMQERTEPSYPPVVAERQPSQAAALARQEELAEEYRMLQESKMLAARRAANATVERKSREQSERGLLTASRGSLLGELRDPQNLRRAFVLREVLGPPVGLR